MIWMMKSHRQKDDWVLSTNKTLRELRTENSAEESVDNALVDVSCADEISKWSNTYLLSDESLKRLSSEAFNLMKTSRFSGDDDGNIDQISRSLRKAELFYLGIKSWAVDTLRYSPKVDKVLSKTIVPTRCERIDDMVTMVFPFMFPHRMPYHKTRLYAYEVRDALLKLDLSDWNQKRKYCVAFVHEYAPDFAREKFRDNDNTEEKWLIDSMVGVLFPDDGAMNIDIFQTSKTSEQTDTIVKVFPAECLPEYFTLLNT